MHPLPCRSISYISQPFFNGQAVEDRSYAALIGPAAAICTHRRTGLAAVVISHPVPNGLAAM